MNYTRFERARIIGARALQISMGAPTLSVEVQNLVDPLSIATREFESATIPIHVQRLQHAFH